MRITTVCDQGIHYMSRSKQIIHIVISLVYSGIEHAHNIQHLSTVLANVNLPSIHNFSTLVSSLALYRPSAQAISTTKPIMTTCTLWFCAWCPSLKRNVCIRARNHNERRFPLARPYDRKHLQHTFSLFKYKSSISLTSSYAKAPERILKIYNLQCKIVY